ncbi:MAG: multidrug efflux MFS transporter [Peptococcaceae bacterium]|nr:multidrug efflux MFS transporter [Peptococcaceae bacterium]
MANAANTLEQMGLSRKVIIINAIMIFGGFIGILNQTLLTPALPSIMKEMQVDASTAQWLTTGYMLVNGIMVPVTAFLIDKFTTRRLFFAAMGIFSLGTLTAAISGDFSIVLLARVLQAAGAGIMMPMGQVLMLLTVPKQYRGTGMGMIGIVMGAAPCIGPVAAGVVIDAFNWHMLFFGLTPLALLTIVIAWFYLDNFGSPKDVQLDITSVVLSTLGFGGLLYGFSVIGSSGFSVVVLASLLIGAIALALFIHRQLHMKEPLLKMELLKNHTFTVSVLLVMLVNAAILVGGILMPIYVQTIRGFSATMSSLIMLPSALVSALMSPISGRLFDKHGARKLAVPGLFIIITASFMLTRLTETTPLFYVGLVYCFRMLGLSLINMPLNTWGLNSLDNSVMSHGTAIGNTFRNVAGSLGTAILVTTMSLTIAFAPNPSSNIAQISGINNAYLGGTLMMVAALVLTVLFVKE